ncbi:MAG TPA: PadR family transcriptional regulator [Streptosporangiaceae bacterium]|nr:PadR family transcriptional regulator [Streptosporangiaceae bacterium]
MPTPRWRGWDFDPGLSDLLDCAGGMLGHVKRAATRMHATPGGGPWGAGEAGARGFVGPKGPGPWGGGGPWGGWWFGTQGPPGPPRGPKAGRGDVRAAILALLRDGPRTGYQIMSDIEERSGGAWRPSPGAVYPALAQLADEGLIVGEESAGRRTFSLTEAGRAYIGQHPDMARGAWESREQQEAWEVPGLFAEAARLGGGIVQIAHAGTPEQVRAAERLLEQTRRRLYQILADDLDDDVDDDVDDDEAEDDLASEPQEGEHGHE